MAFKLSIKNTAALYRESLAATPGKPNLRASLSPQNQVQQLIVVFTISEEARAQKKNRSTWRYNKKWLQKHPWRLQQPWWLQEASSAALKNLFKANRSPFFSPKPAVMAGSYDWCLSAAAELLWHQQGVVSIDLQQVEQEEPVTVWIQTHGPHALLGYGGVRAPSHLAQGLKNPVVLLQEKTLEETDMSVSASCYTHAQSIVLHLQNKEILFTGHTISILLLGVQQHLPTHTHTCFISTCYTIDGDTSSICLQYVWSHDISTSLFLLGLLHHAIAH